jgi:hypothetical protein
VSIIIFLFFFSFRTPSCCLSVSVLFWRWRTSLSPSFRRSSWGSVGARLLVFCPACPSILSHSVYMVSPVSLPPCLSPDCNGTSSVRPSVVLIWVVVFLLISLIIFRYLLLIVWCCSVSITSYYIIYYIQEQNIYHLENSDRIYEAMGLYCKYKCLGIKINEGRAGQNKCDARNPEQFAVSAIGRVLWGDRLTWNIK